MPLYDPECRFKMTFKTISTQEQAMLCESSNHWAMAAILWRRIDAMPTNKYWKGAKQNAEACELILYNLAMNPKFSLVERKPVFAKEAR